MSRITCIASVVFLMFAVNGDAEVVLETVAVGDPGNAGEWSGESYGGSGPDRVCGSVDRAYRIGKYEVTNAQYCEFLNAVAALDANGLYTTEMAGGWEDTGGITRSGSRGGYTYSVRDNRGNRPVNYVSWYDALRFANWMHNGQPSGAQDASTTESGAYILTGPRSVVDCETGSLRCPGALVFLPSEDEWYKAAYYKGCGASAGYWDYPTETDDPDPPTAEAPPGTDLVSGSANYYDGGYVDTAYYTTVVGAYNTEDPPGTYVSDSAYGTFDQGGNVWEWNEARIDDNCGLRGGYFVSHSDDLHAAARNDAVPSAENAGIGFRVAEVSEPADIDFDGDVDLRDFALFQAAFGGPQ